MAKNNIPISIIIPNYNSSKFIQELLDSISKQTFTKFEVLIYDDGSTDDSLSLINNFFEKNNNITHKIFIGNHNGVSYARNYCIKKSKGDYIYFCDSDDLLLPNTLSSLYKSIRKNKSDVSFGNYYIFKEQKFNIDKAKEVKFKEFHNSNLIFSKLMKDEIGSQIWFKLFSSKLIKDIEFPVNKTYEDVFFSTSVFSKTKKYAQTNDFVYCYRLNPNGISLSKDIFKHYFLCQAFYDRFVHLRENSNEKKLISIVASKCMHFLFTSLFMIKKISNPPLCKKELKIVFNELMPYIDKKNINYKLKMKIYLLKYFPCAIDLISAFYRY